MNSSKRVERREGHGGGKLGKSRRKQIVYVVRMYIIINNA